MSVLDTFHPAVANWFRRTYTMPTPPQVEAWPLIQSGRHVLIAAPTGSGKTLAAFLAAIDALVRLGVRNQLRDETRIVYVSPLKALSNDIHKNLEEPLAGIRQELIALGLSGCARSARWYAPGTRPRRSAEDAAQAAAHPGDHPRVAVHPASPASRGAKHSPRREP